MFVPRNLKEIGDFANQLIAECSVSMQSRMERGHIYRNVYLTGSPDGTPQTYKKTYAYIDDLSSLLYSPAELKLSVAPLGKAGPRERALGHAAGSQLNIEFRRSYVDAVAEDAVTWALVKGKTIVQLLWNKTGFEPHLIQPELFGVREEGKATLDAQKAFFHRTWITLDDFADRVRLNPNKTDLMKSVQKYAGPAKEKDSDSNYQTTRMVMLGGLYPYQISGSPIPGQNKNRGVADWLTAPLPTMSPETRAQQLALDELWVWDSEDEDWVTVQTVGPDCVITPHTRLSNAFSEWIDPTDRRKKAPDDKENPLRGKHPFVEFCINRTPDYFWGDSEVRIVGSVQSAINARIDGINKILRKQEDPPRIIAGASINQNAYAKLNKPGGYLTDPNPGLKHEELTPKVPQDMWQSLHEYIAMFHDLGGLPPVTRGEGAAGVRSQGHAETLVRMASPRFKDRAIAIERSVSAIGGLGIDILKAKNGEPQVAWIKEAFAGPFKEHALDPLLYEPPAPGLFGIEFLYAHLDDSQSVTVDSHSSSPIFAHDVRELVFALVRINAISPKDAIDLLQPPRAEELIEDLDQREAEQAAYAAAHPEAAHGHAHGGRRK